MNTVMDADTVNSSTELSSDEVHAAWDRRYPTKMVKLQRGDAEPFVPGRRLGKGGFGSVHETKLDGIVVALKQIWIRGRPTTYHQAEFQILQKMSTKRHRHVVEAIGLYDLPGRSETELGLLIWPVAQYDLARLLSHFNVLSTIRTKCSVEKQSVQLTDDEKDALEDLSTLSRRQWHHGAWNEPADRIALVDMLLKDSTVSLSKVFGCLAEAIRYLHNDQQIRHKDLKPSQVLISSNGLWLTDFGWSIDLTSRSNSATSNGERTTTKYHAPEREQMGRCGRSEDIFGLGCVYIEVALALSHVSSKDILNPEGQESWAFQSSLDQAERWVQSISGELASLGTLIVDMLAREPSRRPSISEIVGVLLEFEATGTVARYHVFGPCCMTNNTT